MKKTKKYRGEEEGEQKEIKTNNVHGPTPHKEEANVY